LLFYIQRSIALIDEYTQSGREAFLDAPVLQDAVVRRLETLADAASHLSDELKTRHPEIPWREVYGFRNVAAHGYLELDLGRVWTTVEISLPVLKAAVGGEISSLS
jgi:uncharacterized protein with HEPN domain